MRKTFNTKIKSLLSYSFEIDKDDLYTISVKAVCQPGWKNKWWLKFKNILEDILDFHLDDEDLRVKIDGQSFKKPRDKKGLFNSPAAFSGTKTLGKTKTIIFVVYLKKGSHTITFIPDGSPYLENMEIEKLTNPQQLNFDLNTPAENENYYSWYTFALVDLPLQSLSITAQAGVLEGRIDDDDLKIFINGEVQKNPHNHHQQSYFCGLTLKGRQDTFSKTLHLEKNTYYLEIFADKTPVLKTVRLTLEQEKEIPIIDPPKTADVFNPQYLLRDSAFIDNHSMTEEQIEEFFKKYGEPYSNHLYHRTFDGKKTFFWIKKYAGEYQINPKVILTKLQAETGLVKGSVSVNPNQQQLDYALGVGCLPNKPCDPRFKGFVTQIESSNQTFRNNFERAQTNNFEVMVEGKPLKAINKATFSILKYSPVVSSAKLFYDVYEDFFGTTDLGGTLETIPRSTLKSVILTAVILVIVSLFISAWRIQNLRRNEFDWESKRILGTKNEPSVDLPSYHSTTPFSNGYKMDIKVKINSIKQLEPGEYWCGAPFLFDYEGSASAKIVDRNGLIVNELRLTSPTLVLGKPPDYNFYFYKLYDLDGDGERNEFILLKYFSCNGNFLKVIKLDTNEHKFISIPFKSEENIIDEIMVGPTKEYFGFDNGQLWVKAYNLLVGKFYTDIFSYQDGVFKRTDGFEE